MQEITSPAKRPKLELCTVDQCTRKAVYGAPDATPTVCRLHKHQGMIYRFGPQCQGPSCRKHPTFGEPGTNRPLYCKAHLPTDSLLVNVTKKLCQQDGCKSAAVFGMPDPGAKGVRQNGRQKLTYCRRHKTEGMINHAIKFQCEYEDCEVQASHSFPEDPKKFRRCAKHALPEMKNYGKAKCKVGDNCLKFPTFGYPGSKAEACKSHSLPGMKSLRQHFCLFEGCSKESSWGFTKDRKMLMCSQHRQEDMVQLRTKRCAQEGCPLRASHNLPGQKALFCKKHSAPGMVYLNHSLCREENCTKQARYNYQGEQACFCHIHKLVGMRNMAKKQAAQTHCASHLDPKQTGL